MVSSAEPGNGIDSTTAHPARRYNYWLGGKDNFAADRESGDAIEKIFPHIRTAAVANRQFLQRAVRWLVTEAGIRQFLDIGTGLPTADNTHQIAQRHAPDANILYVDNDPLVLTHARALLRSEPSGRTEYIQADVRNPASILDSPALRNTLDLNRPVALLIVAVLHFVPESDDPYAAVATLLDSLPAGSYLVLSHATADLLPAEVTAVLKQVPGNDFTDRNHDQVSRFFAGLELVPPGLTVVSDWRPDQHSAAKPAPEQVSVYGGVARKPA